MGLSNLLRLPRQHFFVVLPCLVVWAAGCTDLHGVGAPAVVARGAAQTPPQLPQLPKDPRQGEQLPAPKDEKVVNQVRLGFAPLDTSKMVPINLDTVLRLAESQNGQTAIAREKLNEAFANCDLAAKAWLPDLWVGGGWYRHEGGIADFNGNLITSSYGSMFAGLEVHGRLDLRDAIFLKVDAERRVWQQRAEVKKLTHEALLEATTTYVDLLSARAAEAIALQVEGHSNDLLKQTEALAKSLPVAEIEVARIQAEIHGERQLLRKFRENALTATAKLIYLLGLHPHSELVLMDRHLVAFQLTNADLPTDELVGQALHSGPGIRELEGLLQVIHHGQEQSQGLNAYLPVLDLRVAEGGFGTGPGDRMDWDNRLDVGFQVRWNLTEWCTRCERQRAVQAKVGQAHATYQDLRAKLTLGVQEAREGVLSGRDQMELGQKQVKAATEAFDRSKTRFNQAPNLKDRVPSEILLSIRAMHAASLAYILAIREHDKAQLRLAILTGMAGGHCEH